MVEDEGHIRDATHNTIFLGFTPLDRFVLQFGRGESVLFIASTTSPWALKLVFGDVIIVVFPRLIVVIRDISQSRPAVIVVIAVIIRIVAAIFTTKWFCGTRKRLLFSEERNAFLNSLSHTTVWNSETDCFDGCFSHAGKILFESRTMKLMLHGKLVHNPDNLMKVSLISNDWSTILRHS